MDMLHKLQTQVCRTVGPSLAASLEPLVHCQNLISLIISIGIILVDVHLTWVNKFQFLILVVGPLVILTYCLIILSPFQMLQGYICQISFLKQLDFGILCP